MRRKLAVRLLDRGIDGQGVAEAFDVSPGSVTRWKQAYEEDGMEGLKADPYPGKDPILDNDQLLELATCLRDGPEAYGFETDLWTRRRVAEVIEEEFGESVSKATAYRYLQKMGWSYGKLERRAVQRDEEAIKEWREQQFQQIQKKLGKNSG